jgi:hypothetical protein
MPANTNQAVETSPTGKTIITAMNHLSEYNFLQALNLAHRNVITQSKDIPSKISAGINVLILTVALGTMRHGADLVIISTPFSADIVLERSPLGL